MTARIQTSAPMRPRTYTPKPQRVADRIHIHGRDILPMDEPGMGGKLGFAVMCAVVLFISFALTVGLLGPHAATDAHSSRASGITAASSVAGRR